MKVLRLAVMVFLLCLSSLGICGDLDDGIGIDTPINDDINSGINVQFIRRNVVAKARREAKKAEEADAEGAAEGGEAEALECDGAGNINIGPGTDLSGVKQIINVSTTVGTSTVCTK